MLILRKFNLRFYYAGLKGYIVKVDNDYYKCSIPVGYHPPITKDNVCDGIFRLYLPDFIFEPSRVLLEYIFGNPFF